MSNTRKTRPTLRNLQVLMARATAEVKPGWNIAHVQHDDWCRSLTTLSMLDCRCSPVIEFEQVGETVVGL